MKLSHIAGVLGLDETDGVSLVPLTDEAIAAAAPNRATRRAAEQTEKRRKKRHVTRSLGGG